MLAEFNVDLLKYDYHPKTNEFLEFLSSHIFIPHIIKSTRVSSNSKTLIDIYFSNVLTLNFFSGNLTAKTFNNLLRFTIVTIFLTHLLESLISMKGIGVTFINKIPVFNCFSEDWENVTCKHKSFF